jgi:hypothetical protein
MLAVQDVRPELIKFSAWSIAFFFVDAASFPFSPATAFTAQHSHHSPLLRLHIYASSTNSKSNTSSLRMGFEAGTFSC